MQSVKLISKDSVEIDQHQQGLNIAHVDPVNKLIMIISAL